MLRKLCWEKVNQVNKEHPYVHSYKILHSYHLRLRHAGILIEIILHLDEIKVSLLRSFLKQKVEIYILIYAKETNIIREKEKKEEMEWGDKDA